MRSKANSFPCLVASLAMFSLLLVHPAQGATQHNAIFRFVGEKSVYYKVGIRSGDTILSVDGISPRSAAEAGQLISTRRGDGKRHTMRLLRGGKILMIEFR